MCYPAICARTASASVDKRPSDGARLDAIREVIDNSSIDQRYCRDRFPRNIRSNPARSRKSMRSIRTRHVELGAAK